MLRWVLHSCPFISLCTEPFLVGHTRPRTLSRRFLSNDSSCLYQRRLRSSSLATCWKKKTLQKGAEIQKMPRENWRASENSFLVLGPFFRQKNVWKLDHHWSLWRADFFKKILLFYEGWQIPRDTMDRLLGAFACKHVPNVHIKCKQAHENTTAFFVKFLEISPGCRGTSSERERTEFLFPWHVCLNSMAQTELFELPNKWDKISSRNVCHKGLRELRMLSKDLAQVWWAEVFGCS